MGDQMREIRLDKGEQTFIVRYVSGAESSALDHLCQMVNRRDLDFTWFDAGKMARQLGEQLHAELALYLPK